MENKKILVKRMADFARDVRYEAAGVFVDGYFKELSFFTKDREKLKTAFKDIFCPEVFYLAEMDGEIVGMLACANNRQRAMPVDKAAMKRGLGFVRGSLAYHMLKNEFNSPLNCSDDSTYIECVATNEKARGKGVCTALFQHVLRELPYREYLLEVVDTNRNACRLYKKLGFEEFKRKPERYPRIKGFNERIYMSWCR